MNNIIQNAVKGLKQDLNEQRRIVQSLQDEIDNLKDPEKFDYENEDFGPDYVLQVRKMLIGSFNRHIELVKELKMQINEFEEFVSDPNVGREYNIYQEVNVAIRAKRNQLFRDKNGMNTIITIVPANYETWFKTDFVSSKFKTLINGLDKVQFNKYCFVKIIEFVECGSSIKMTEVTDNQDGGIPVINIEPRQKYESSKIHTVNLNKLFENDNV